MIATRTVLLGESPRTIAGIPKAKPPTIELLRKLRRLIRFISRPVDSFVCMEQEIERNGGAGDE
jgi:hypothetical protein